MIDLHRPLRYSCEIKGVQSNQQAFWHSSAHILGYAIEQYFNDPLLTVGPPTSDGFFYDFFSPSGQVVSSPNDFATLEASIKKIIKAKHRFERLELSKEEALDLFSYNRFKTYLIENKVPDDGLTSVYKVGDFIDLCTGPHLPHTGHVKAFKLMKNSATYWLGEN